VTEYRIGESVWLRSGGLCRITSVTERDGVVIYTGLVIEGTREFRASEVEAKFMEATTGRRSP
jgi:hypothetical protein